MSIFSDRLKHLRNEHHLSQVALAKELHVSQNAIYNWENDKRGVSLETISKIADFFNVSPSFLIGWENENTIYIADNLKRIMKLKSISVEDLSQQSGIPSYEIDSILKNGRAPVSYIPKLANALDVTTKYLNEYNPQDITSEKLRSQASLKKIIKIDTQLHSLNDLGLEEAYRQIELLTKIPEYREDNNDKKE